MPEADSRPAGGYLLPLWSYAPAGGEHVEVMTRAAVETRLVARAIRDEAFRDRLLHDPRAVLEQELDLSIPEGVRLHVLQEADRDVILVLPHNPFSGRDEASLRRDAGLSFEELARWVAQDRQGALLDPERSASLVARAWDDERFRAGFLEDPRSAIAAHLDLALPEGHRVTAVEETPTDVFIVLPHVAGGEGSGIEFSADLEQANLGGAYVMVVGQSDRCAGTCIVNLNSNHTCYVTCVDRQNWTVIYRDESPAEGSGSLWDRGGPGAPIP